MVTPFLRLGCTPGGCCLSFIHSFKRCLLQTAVTALKITFGPLRLVRISRFQYLRPRSNGATFHCGGQFTAAQMTGYRS